MRGTRWLRRAVGPLLVALAAHLLTVWALPRVIMWRLAAQATPDAAALVNGAFFPPMTDHTARRVVMPSPDLLYATCRMDLSQGPLRIQADPKTPRYWSIALYASNSDNFFVLNDRQANGQPVDLWLVGPHSPVATDTGPAGARRVQAPSAQGLLLMRVLVSDYARDQGVVEAARRSLRCTPS